MSRRCNGATGLWVKGSQTGGMWPSRIGGMMSGARTWRPNPAQVSAAICRAVRALRSSRPEGAVLCWQLGLRP